MKIIQHPWLIFLFGIFYILCLRGGIILCYGWDFPVEQSYADQYWQDRPKHFPEIPEEVLAKDREIVRQRERLMQEQQIKYKTKSMELNNMSSIKTEPLMESAEMKNILSLLEFIDTNEPVELSKKERQELEGSLVLEEIEKANANYFQHCLCIMKKCHRYTFIPKSFMENLFENKTELDIYNQEQRLALIERINDKLPIDISRELYYYMMDEIRRNIKFEGSCHGSNPSNVVGSMIWDTGKLVKNTSTNNVLRSVWGGMANTKAEITGNLLDIIEANIRKTLKSNTIEDIIDRKILFHLHTQIELINIAYLDDVRSYYDRDGEWIPYYKWDHYLEHENTYDRYFVHTFYRINNTSRSRYDFNPSRDKYVHG